jgi:hypothetical protein
VEKGHKKGGLAIKVELKPQKYTKVKTDIIAECTFLIGKF